MKKRLFILLIIISIISTSLTAMAASKTTAEKLYELGLLSNISSSELNTRLNRIIGLTMVLKSIGYTDLDAKNASKSHTFTDLSDSYKWGSGWANIGVEKSITTGTSGSAFSPGELMTKKEFLAYQLRILGYGVNESWDNCAKLSVQAGLIPSEQAIKSSYGRFTKGQASDILYAALNAKLKEQPEVTLANKLVADGVIDQDQAMKQNIASLNKIEITGVTPIANNKLEVSLKNSIYYINKSQLSILDYYGKQVIILSTKLLDKGQTIEITTETQKSYLPHTLLGYKSSISYSPLYQDNQKPYLTKVQAMDNKTIKLTFNEPVDQSALSIRNYSITNNLYPIKAVYELEEKEGEKTPNKSSVILTTSKQSHNIQYKITASNIMDMAGNTINSYYKNLYFTGIGQDTTKPRLNSVYAITPNKIQVNFSETVDQITAEDIQNYGIQGYTITEAKMQEQGSVVCLTVFEQMDQGMKILRVSNIKDMSGNSIDSAYSQYSFWGNISIMVRPRLLHAISLSDTTIRVTFSKPISDETGSMETAYYLGEELSYPIKVEKDKYTSDGTVWILTTPERENKEYTLIVNGVQDREGNWIDGNNNSSGF